MAEQVKKVGQLVLLSTHPEPDLVLQSGEKQMIRLEDGRYRELNIKDDRVVSFKRHVAWIPETESEAIKALPGYSTGYVFLRDLRKMERKADDKITASGFKTQMMRKSVQSGEFPMRDYAEVEDYLRELEVAEQEKNK